MPTDTKRVVGPSESFPVEKLTGSDISLADFIGRKNDRALHKHRPIFLKPRVVTQARGSAYIELADTKIICAVFGPRESIRREDFSMIGQLNCDLKFAPFSCRGTRRHHQQDQQEREMSEMIGKAFQPAVRLDQYQKGVIDISIKVLQDDGNVLGAAITAVSVALATAGIEMYDLVVGATVKQYGETILVDPDHDEECRLKVVDVRNDGNLTLALMTSLNQVSTVAMDGQIDGYNFTKCVQAAMEACYQIYPVLRKLLAESLTDS